MTCDDCEYLIQENVNLKNRTVELENKVNDLQSRIEQIRTYVY